MIVSLGAMGIARKLPLQDPEYLPLLRAAYFSMQLLVLAAYYFCTIKVRGRASENGVHRADAYDEGSRPC